VLPAERQGLRARYESARHAAWAPGATLARAGAGFGGQVDLAAVFTERALALARPGGTVALLLPAKLWRTLAGGGLRALVRREAVLHALEDWTHAPAAFEAATYPSLLVATRAADPREALPAHPPPVAVRIHLGHGTVRADAPADALPLEEGTGAPWLLLPPAVRAAVDALRAAGAPSPLLRPSLGVKCGRNEAFLVRVVAHDGPLAHVRQGARTGTIERSLLRPALRGEHLAAGDAQEHDDPTWILWPYDADGRVLPQLPPHAARWLAPARADLATRADARRQAHRTVGAPSWWTLFRTEAARRDRARVVWADLARAPHPRLLAPGDPHVPLNTCYVAAFDDPLDARAVAALLAAPPIVAWLGALAEPARGGYRRHLAWTVALLPLPRHWARARLRLAPLVGATPEALTRAVADAYELPPATLAPLLAWDAATAPPARRQAAVAPAAVHEPTRRHWRVRRDVSAARP
jgi:hypothetical protein